jgi:hypothetical protein
MESIKGVIVLGMGEKSFESWGRTEWLHDNLLAMIKKYNRRLTVLYNSKRKQQINIQEGYLLQFETSSDRYPAAPARRSLILNVCPSQRSWWSLNFPSLPNGGAMFQRQISVKHPLLDGHDERERRY